jgi:hypothetical protein
MSNVKKFSLIKPTIETPFQIDFNWWKSHDQNWRVYLQSYLCKVHKQIFSSEINSLTIDWVDPETAEVKPVDGVEHTLMTHCAKQPEFLTEHTALVNSVFRIFLSNGNSPLTCAQLSSITGKSADIILRTLTGTQVYKGIRPIQIKH